MCNRLFHYMGFKNLIWIHERNLKNYLDPSQVVGLPGEQFLIQNAVHGAWCLGTFYEVENRSICYIRWTNVIVIKGENQ